MNAMNQHEEFKEKPVIDPVTGQPLPQTQTQMSDVPPPARSGRSNWPIVIILLAGLVLALIAWLPAELSRDTADTAAPPATTDQPATGTTTAPADTGTAPAGGTTTQPAPEATPQAPETQGSAPNSTPGTTPGMTQPAQ
ncbi:hypothetical protein [Ensifer adhaerens]|uniref:hypothetical protein n=1 Tax=Ensifer adhaerens TaxID=106592 RepID=UPI00098EC42E|nr:hypothetical protein [Ensifer adhaerens]